MPGSRPDPTPTEPQPTHPPVTNRKTAASHRDATMSTTPMVDTTRRDGRRTRRPLPQARNEGGWVLLATLVLSALVVSVTVTYARHAVLAKKSLEVAQGASEAEEASRSGLERTRELMQRGDLPGTIDEGAEDIVQTPTGETVISEREVKNHRDRGLKVRAHGNGNDVEDEANLRAQARIQPGAKGPKATRFKCETGQGYQYHGATSVITGNVVKQNEELVGILLLEAGSTLTLDNVVLRGAIVTHAGLCDDNPPLEDAMRPQVTVYNGLRILDRPDLIPDTAVCAPDARISCDSNARVEMRGLVVAEELEVPGRGSMRGLVVSKQTPVLSTKVRRPGHGRGLQSWPETIEPASESVRRMGFPFDKVDGDTLVAMNSCDVD